MKVKRITLEIALPENMDDEALDIYRNALHEVVMDVTREHTPREFNRHVKSWVEKEVNWNNGKVK